MHTKAIKDVAQDTIDQVEDKVLESMDKARETSDKVAERAAVAEDQLQKTLESASASLSEYITEKPLQAAGIAFTAGVLATLLLSRR